MKNEKVHRGCFVILSMLEKTIKVSAGVLCSACLIGLGVAGFWDLSEKRSKVTRSSNK